VRADAVARLPEGVDGVAEGLFGDARADEGVLDFVEEGGGFGLGVEEGGGVGGGVCVRGGR